MYLLICFYKIWQQSHQFWSFILNQNQHFPTLAQITQKGFLFIFDNNRIIDNLFQMRLNDVGKANITLL